MNIDFTVEIQINLTSLLVWATVATILLTLVMSASQGFGWSRVALPFILGSIFTARRGRAMLIGLILHLIIGWLAAFLYILIFEELRMANAWIGLLIGFFHGVFVLMVVLPVLDPLHPRMASKHWGPTPSRQLEPPGFLGLNYGRSTPFTTLAAHVLYGVILGAFYLL